MSKLQPAISRLAALYPYGELTASTDPVNFLDGVTKEVAQLRGENARLRRLADLVRVRCRRAVPEWAPELRAALREMDASVSEGGDKHG